MDDNRSEGKTFFNRLNDIILKIIYVIQNTSDYHTFMSFDNTPEHENAINA